MTNTFQIPRRTITRLLRKFGWQKADDPKGYTYFHPEFNLKRSAKSALDFEAYGDVYQIHRSEKEYPLVLPDFKLSDIRTSCA